MLLYSIGLGIPFIISAILIDRLKTTFDFIKKNYKTVNIICGIFLIIIGKTVTDININILTKLKSKK